MKATTKHYVTFYSPGTFVHEQTTREIGEWNPRKAVALAEKIVERHGAKPFGFRFETRSCAPDIDDGAGGVIPGAQKTMKTSGLHFLGGTLETIDDIERRGDPREDILVSNMRCNEYPIVCVNTNSWKSVQPFEQDSVIVGPDGAVLERGDDTKWVEYRAAAIEARKRS